MGERLMPRSGIDTVSERLRRWTRNPLGSARRGSNPLGVALRQMLSSDMQADVTLQQCIGAARFRYTSECKTVRARARGDEDTTRHWSQNHWRRFVCFASPERAV